MAPFGSMLRFLATCLVIATATACATPQAVATGEPMRVMAFNVRVPVDTDGNRWELRRDRLVETIREAAPDLVGTQELVRAQAGFIVGHLPEYAWFGTGRRGAQGDANDEYMGVFYRRDALRLVESGDFWLSDTPDAPGSMTWGNLYPRMVTWGLFERVSDGRRFYFLDTHLPYRDEDGPVRVRAAEAIVQWIAGLPVDVPVILAGDFNDVPGSATHRALTGGLEDAWTEAPRREGPEGTFHGFTGTPGKRIDWILYRGLQPTHVRTIVDHSASDGDYPSDHFPVLAEFE